ncbi:MAG: hypothetical protein LBK04_02145 [Clostridiales Family XIII bacterium]|jgi:hypothetical protein|nr:hypothetical protein [Clostridiales Family XIII bacterium]
MCAKMMSDKEAEAYAKRLENEIPSIRLGECGPLTRERDQAALEFLDGFSAQYIRAKARATNKPVSEIIGDLVRKDLESA